MLDHKNATSRTKDGRRIEHYTHGPRTQWGYPASASQEWRYHAAQETGQLGQNHNSFYVVLPKPHRNAPLCVVMHSANRTAFDYLGFQFLDRAIDPTDEPAAVITRVPNNCYALYLNTTNDEWWGWTAARGDRGKYGSTLTPAENRLLDTIRWVMEHFKIDRNRVYLSGVSMGGCGALALGLAHGDLFAAMLADVAAGTEFAALRIGFPPRPGLADPPILVDFFATNDEWSEGQPALLQAAQTGRLPFVAAWGPFGHTAFVTPISRYPEDDVALAFPWLELRRNAAYPVFTSASSNQRPPQDEAGQINAYFRWEDRTDTRSNFAMKMWIAHPHIADPPQAMPDTSDTDITLRRLQSFKVLSGKTYAWRLVRSGTLVASGTAVPDATNHLTIPRVTLSVIPAELSITAE